MNDLVIMRSPAGSVSGQQDTSSRIWPWTWPGQRSQQTLEPPRMAAHGAQSWGKHPGGLLGRAAAAAAAATAVEAAGNRADADPKAETHGNDPPGKGISGRRHIGCGSSGGHGEATGGGAGGQGVGPIGEESTDHLARGRGGFRIDRDRAAIAGETDAVGIQEDALYLLTGGLVANRDVITLSEPRQGALVLDFEVFGAGEQGGDVGVRLAVPRSLADQFDRSRRRGGTWTAGG